MVTIMYLPRRENWFPDTKNPSGTECYFTPPAPELTQHDKHCQSLIGLCQPLGTTARVSAMIYKPQPQPQAVKSPAEEPQEPRHSSAPAGRARLRERGWLPSCAKHHETLSSHTQHHGCAAHTMKLCQESCPPRTGAGNARRSPTGTLQNGEGARTCARVEQSWRWGGPAPRTHPAPQGALRRSWPAGWLQSERRQMVIISRTLIPWKFPCAWERGSPSPCCCPRAEFHWSFRGL